MLAFADIRVAALTWLLLPCLLQLNYAHWGQEKAFLAEAASPESAPLSGVNLHRRLVEPLKAKAAYLATMRDKGTTIYLSRDSQLIPLMTGQLNPFDAQDVYLEHFGAPEVERIVHDIRTSNPRYILIDEPFSPLSRTDFAYEYRMPFFDTIVNSLADQYREVGAASDWRILARIQH